jgi:nucleoside-diphosphate-sugar epimerase
MDNQLPGIVVTGASGFVGRNFLASIAGRYRLFCLARRSRLEAGIPEYENMRWTQVDVASWDTLRDVVRCVKEHGGAEYVLHLAGYYDFHNMEHPEYERTNVTGTRNVLKMAQQLGVKRFIFASSLAACTFPPDGQSLTENSLPDATFAYARSKRKGEDLIREYEEWFPSAIIRMAAVYSDWCEYAPLHIFLKTWLSRDWNANMLGGEGRAAVPYIHIKDLVKVFHRVIECNDQLPRLGVYNASSSGIVSHRDLYLTATRLFYGEAGHPRFIPKALAVIGLHLRWWLGKLRGREPFEAPWMGKYIDLELRVDATRTHEILGWEPASRLDILRRLLIMIENMKSHSEVWRQRNEAALKRVGSRPNLQISFALAGRRDEMLDKITKHICAPENAGRFCNYADMEPDAMRWFIALIYQILISAVRTRDLQLIRNYAQVIAIRRKREGFSSEQVQSFLIAMGDLIAKELRNLPEMADYSQQIHDLVTLSFGLAADGVEDAYEMMDLPDSGFAARHLSFEIPSNTGDLEAMVRQLGDICEESIPVGLDTEP